MRTPFRLVLISLLITPGCYPEPTVQPRWIADLVPKLRCGMGLNEIRNLTEKEVLELDGGHWFLGTVRISTNWHDVWLRFNGEGLQAVTWGSAVDSKNTRLSPRFDLCSDDLSFLLTVTWTSDFVGADVLLDGELIETNARVAPPIVLTTKPHELQIDVDGHQPVVRRFNLTVIDRGDQSVYLSGEDLHPFGEVQATVPGITISQ